MFDKNEEAKSDEFEQTDIWLNRSKNGKGLNVKSTGDYVLTVSIESVKKVINGEIGGTRFSKFKAVAKSEGMDV